MAETLPPLVENASFRPGDQCTWIELRPFAELNEPRNKSFSGCKFRAFQEKMKKLKYKVNDYPVEAGPHGMLW